MMRLLHPTKFFPLILFIISCFGLRRAIDCGGNHVASVIVVDQLGKGKFTTIQAAIDSVPQNNSQWIKIQTTPGKYVEKVQISYQKSCIILDDNKSTLLTYNQKSATFASSASNVVFNGMTFENTFGDTAPALAASIYGDKTAIYNCSFLGYQDTLFDASGRHYYKDCYIQGEVDFIFGSASTYFEDCLINATQAPSQPPGFITAQYRKSQGDPSGFVFRRGQVVGIGKVDLGRAWGPFSRVIFWETTLSSVVSPEGWNAWNYKGKEYQFTYAEINCTGLGANTDSRVAWEKKPQDINLTEYSLSSFVNQDDWLANISSIYV